MKSVHQIITVRLSIISLLQIEIDGWYQNICTGIKQIKFKLLNYCFEENQYKIHLLGEIYQ